MYGKINVLQRASEVRWSSVLPENEYNPSSK